MIKKLQKQFIFITVISVSLVLLLLFATVNFLNYTSTIKRIDNILQSIASAPNVLAETENQLSTDIPIDADQPRPPFVPDSHKKNMNRSFTVLLDINGDVEKVDLTFYSILSEEEALQIVSAAQNDGKEKGFVSDYRYMLSETKNGTKLSIMDCSFELESIKSFFLTSITVLVTGILLVFVLVLLMMKPAIKPIAESYEKQKRFITDASHELKTPLTIISTNTDLIEMESGKSKWTSNTHKQINRLLSLTNELVTLSRMDESPQAINTENISLSNIANEVADGFNLSFLTQGKTFETCIKDNITIKGNHDSIEKMMNILIENALKYSNEKGRVEMTVETVNKKAKVTIRNTVDSIEKGNHNEFFERFYRADKSRNSETGGHGIGLSIAKATVIAHKGKIYAESLDSKSFQIVILI
jgi:signal transduction histidine kinase